IVIAAGIGLADVIDAFSHIHTPLLITLLRIALGLIFGALIGIVAQRIYRVFFRDPSASR
ncbi:MAG TPA: DUF5693 family protein, partial [Candidatus Eremiobacteraceae bacterium]|nr:DUF5693 family protein [Candidatus Eremiobacteraceae bacterium]